MRTLLIGLTTVVTLAIASPASADENFVFEGADHGWTNGPKTVGVVDKECDGNQVRVEHKFSYNGPVHILYDANGCKEPAWARKYPNTGNYKDKILYSLRVCEMVGTTSGHWACSPWRKTGFVQVQPGL